MAKINSLDTAFKILLRVERQEGYCHILLNRAFYEEKDSTGKGHIPEKERALIKRLCEGCLEKRFLLDHFINMYAKTPVNKQKPAIRVILRLGTYEILYMDSVPDHAAVNESVNLAKKHGFKALASFVNGVLRSIAGDKQRISDFESELFKDISESREVPDSKKLSMYYSMPEWIIDKWKSEYPEKDIKNLLGSIGSKRNVCLRFRLDLDANKKACVINEITSKGGHIESGGPDDAFIEISGLSQIGSLEAFKTGLITVQDNSSRLAVELAGIKKGDSILDTCAAPGGKMILASEITGDGGRVLAMDAAEDKLPLMMDNAGRMGRNNIDIRCHDARVKDEELNETFDIVICDVPCSGLGVLSKKKDIRYRIKPEDIADLTDLAREIVKTSVTYLKHGGRFLYSTCTISKAENQDMAQWILKETGMTLVIDKQFFPDSDSTDGFYAAVFKKD